MKKKKINYLNKCLIEEDNKKTSQDNEKKKNRKLKQITLIFLNKIRRD